MQEKCRLSVIDMNRKILLLVLLMLQSSALFAQDVRYPDTPEQVVNDYLRLDAEGAELSKDGRVRLQRLNPSNVAINYQRTLNTPVIVSYKILQVKIVGDKATVAVEYELIGVMTDHFFDFKPRRKKKKIEVLLGKIDGLWRIESEIWPHMSWQAVVRHIKEGIESGVFRESRYNDIIATITEAAKPVDVDNKESPKR